MRYWKLRNLKISLLNYSIFICLFLLICLSLWLKLEVLWIQYFLYVSVFNFFSYKFAITGWVLKLVENQTSLQIGLVFLKDICLIFIRILSLVEWLLVWMKNRWRSILLACYIHNVLLVLYLSIRWICNQGVIKCDWQKCLILVLYSW